MCDVYRSYFRCAYAKEQNCKAAKRVQKIKDDPPVYRTTYSGKHTCAFAVDMNNDDDTYDSKIIHFDRCDHVMSGSVTSVNHQVITMEYKATDQNQITNQECDDNEFLVDDDKFWAQPLTEAEFLHQSPRAAWLGLKKLPLEIGKLQKLKKISMSKCGKCELPDSVRNLDNLAVKCDEETGLFWERLKPKMRNLKVNEVETEHKLEHIALRCK
ncbi:unnamed protein product [Microthlaspi erraticum]|uniref:WRKY domain-containing protein n=1 Tax=Microthlaspi erraticum TaxID=1685480 RepID=A0A6D2I429_9BRAS|nr:unnamed protein product [Microthlaspi erraticum]